MYFRLDRKGKALADSLSFYTEVFAAIAIAECAHMKKDEFLESKAMQMYEFLLSRLGQADDTPTLAYKLLNTQWHIHAHDMCRAIREDRLIYIFGGGGHTCLVMQELFWRAGGLANLCPIIDFAIHPATPAYLYLGHERMHGVGDHRAKNWGLR